VLAGWQGWQTSTREVVASWQQGLASGGCASGLAGSSLDLADVQAT